MELSGPDKVLAKTNDGDWRWMTTDEAMPNPAGGYWIEKPAASDGKGE